MPIEGVSDIVRMPIEGEIRQATIIGYKGGALHVWVICPECQQGRWVVLSYTRRDPRYTGLCLRCQARLRNYKNGNAVLIPVMCSKCGCERWLPRGRTLEKSYTGLCNRCYRQIQHGDQAHRWKGGRCKTKDGYIEVKVQADDFFYPMANHHGYVLEHRLIMAKYLNRCLLSWEIVHHRDGNKQHNTIQNLKLYSIQAKHLPSLGVLRYAKRQAKELDILRQRITLLEAENALLRASVGGGQHESYQKS